MTATIKRRLANRNPWPRILERRFIVKTIDRPEFSGYVTLLCLDAVREPLWIDGQGEKICIVDSGYMWLQHFPIGARHTVTTQFNAAGKVVQWYIDICLQSGINSEGVPWWDDLFLDVIVFPNGECQIVDGDELEEALQHGTVNETQVRIAWDEARSIVSAIKHHNFPLLSLSLQQRELLLAELATH